MRKHTALTVANESELLLLAAAAISWLRENVGKYQQWPLPQQ